LIAAALGTIQNNLPEDAASALTAFGVLVAVLGILVIVLPCLEE
jgi:hypothetical protein